MSAAELERLGRRVVRARVKFDRAKAKADAASAELEAAIREAGAAGATLRPLAKASGLSVEWVRQILARSAVVVVVALAALAFVGVAGAATDKRVPPVPSGLRAVLEAGGYHYFGGGWSKDGKTLSYGASSSDHHRGRFAYREPSASFAFGVLIGLRKIPAARAEYARGMSRDLGVPVRITRVDTWGRYLVVSIVKR